MNRLGKIAAFMAACTAGQAAAHAIIVDSTPAPLGHVPPGPLHIALHYNSRIDAPRSKLTLRHGDEAQRLPATATDAPDTLAAETSLAPGTYDIAWQVLAIDGHVTRGHIPFTVDPPRAASAK